VSGKALSALLATLVIWNCVWLAHWLPGYLEWRDDLARCTQVYNTPLAEQGWAPVERCNSFFSSSDTNDHIPDCPWIETPWRLEGKTYEEVPVSCISILEMSNR
jgi:hypothetical protein